jgi:hypothetical protein
MKVPQNPSAAFCDVLRFADRVRVANNLSDREFRLAMRCAEAIEEVLGEHVGRVEASALCVAIFRCGQRARQRQAERFASN